MNQKGVLALVAAGGLLAACFASAGLVAVLYFKREKQAPAPSPATQPEKVGGHFRGRVLGHDGGPIRVKDAQVSVRVTGVTGRGEQVSFTPPVAADGTFDLKLIEGIYHAPTAELRLPVNGKTFVFRLHPVPQDTTDTPSAEGIVRDFQWKLSGTRPGYDPDPTSGACWYGASLTLSFRQYRNDLGRNVAKPPEGTKVTFTLVPSGPLIDGSASKTLTFERTFHALLASLENPVLVDIPVGGYTLTGVETYPDGTRRAVQLEGDKAALVGSLEVAFEPNRYGDAWRDTIWFTRPE
ncbi:MAG: hypothetical protein ACAI25_17060 [Planctomycetota bacterium]